MSEHGSGKRTEELFALVVSYEEQGEFGRDNMTKKHPHVDFKKLIADAEFMQQANEWKLARAKAHEAHTVSATSGSDNGNIWTTVLEWAAWFTFCAAVGGGFSNARLIMDFADSFMLAFIVFAVIAAIGFLSLAYAMIFIQMAKDISRTAKDTAEVKELLKK